MTRRSRLFPRADVVDSGGKRIDSAPVTDSGWASRNEFINPDAEGSTALVVDTNSTPTISTDVFPGWPINGTKSHKIANSGTAGFKAKIAQANEPPATSGQTWTFAANFYNAAPGPRSFTIQLSARDSSGTGSRGVAVSSPVVIPPNAQARLSFTFTTPAITPAVASVNFSLSSTGAGGATTGDVFYVDAIDFFQGTADRPHLSGRTPGGAWEGTPDASASYGVFAPTAIVREGPLLFTDPRVGGKRDTSMTSSIDNAPAFNRAMALLATSGGKLKVPAGVYPFLTQPGAVPGGVWIEGDGFDYGTPSGAVPSTTRPSRGSVFRALAAMDSLLLLGTGVSLSPGNTGASVDMMSIDANNLANSGIKMFGSRNRAFHTQVYSGLVQGILMACQNGHVENCAIRQDNTGDCILVQGSTVMDNKIWNSQIAGAGTTGAAVHIVDAPNTDIQQCHLWAGGGGVPAANVALIWIVASASGVIGTMITGNTIEGVLSDEIAIDATSSIVVAGTMVTGNKFYMNGGTGRDNLDSLVNVRSGSVSGLVLTGNIADGAGSTSRYAAAISVQSGVTLTGATMAGNLFRYVAAKTSVAGTATIADNGNPIYNGTAWA